MKSAKTLDFIAVLGSNVKL
jgi:hypothetical protein